MVTQENVSYGDDWQHGILNYGWNPDISGQTTIDTGGNRLGTESSDYLAVEAYREFVMTIRRLRVRSDMAIQLALLLILLSLLQPLASADEVLINDGSRLIGEVVRHDTGVLKLKTSFAGTLEIDWAEVKEVIFSVPGTVLLADDQVLEIRSLSSEGDQFILYTVI